MSLKLFYLKVQLPYMSFWAVSKTNKKFQGSGLQPPLNYDDFSICSKLALSSQFFFTWKTTTHIMRNKKETHVIYFKQFSILAQRLKKNSENWPKKLIFGQMWPLYTKKMSNRFIFWKYLLSSMKTTEIKIIFLYYNFK